MPWIQTYTPVGGSLGMSALVAAIPLVVIFVCLAVLKMKAHKAGPLAVASAIAIAIAVWGMPAKLAGLAFMQGAAFGLFPYVLPATTDASLGLTVHNAAAPDANEHKIFHASVPLPYFMSDAGQGPGNILLVQQYLNSGVCHKCAKKKPSRSIGKAFVRLTKGISLFNVIAHHLISFCFFFISKRLPVYLSQPFCEVKEKHQL